MPHNVMRCEDETGQGRRGSTDAAWSDQRRGWMLPGPFKRTHTRPSRMSTHLPPYVYPPSCPYGSLAPVSRGSTSRPKPPVPCRRPPFEDARRKPLLQRRGAPQMHQAYGMRAAGVPAWGSRTEAVCWRIGLRRQVVSIWSTLVAEASCRQGAVSCLTCSGLQGQRQSVSSVQPLFPRRLPYGTTSQLGFTSQQY